MFPLPAITFIVGLVVVALVVGNTARLDMLRSQDAAYRTAQVYSARIESLLESLFHKTDVLEAIIIVNGGRLSEETFIDVAASLGSNGEGIRSIQYQPGGVSQYLYPLEGNEKVVGSDVFEDSMRRDDALLAVSTKHITLSGPYELMQGGLGLVARNPIFITSSSGRSEFWGFSTIVLNLPAALDPIMLGDLEKDGYRYELSSMSDTGEPVEIVASEIRPGDDAVQYQVAVPNNNWTLTLTRDKGWARMAPLMVMGLAGIVISLLLAVVVRLVQVRRQALHKLATTDELTRLHNRRWFSQEIEDWCAHTTPFSVLYLDLDNFKAVNDTMGHEYGDALLEQVANRLTTTCGADDVWARLGGDEFVIAMHNVDRRRTEAFAEKLRDVISRPITLGDRDWTMLASIGIALFPEDGTDYDELIRVADSSMYHKKRTDEGVCRLDR